MQRIDSVKAGITIFDSSGIEDSVTENNPKYSNRIIKQLKAYAKAMNFDENYDPYKVAYDSMPSHAASNENIIFILILKLLLTKNLILRMGTNPFSA